MTKLDMKKTEAKLTRTKKMAAKSGEMNGQVVLTKHRLQKEENEGADKQDDLDCLYEACNLAFKV